MVQTVLTKCLGPLSEWERMMELPAKCGFNTVHFSPIQHLGHSGSCYSIYDQLLLSKAIFPVRRPPLPRGAHSLSVCGQEAPEASEAEKERRLKDFVERNAAERGLLSLTDVVWNHTADNTPWLAEHPEAGYASDSSLHLAMAFEVRPLAPRSVQVRSCLSLCASWTVRCCVTRRRL